MGRKLFYAVLLGCFAFNLNAQSESRPMHTYTLSGGFWRTDAGFISTLRIKNSLVVAPLAVTPVLYMTDGTTYELPAVSLDKSAAATINLNDALQSTAA